MPNLLVIFFIIAGCGIDTIDSEDSDQLTIATSKNRVQSVVESNRQLTIPPGKVKYREAIYADVDPSDNLKIIFLLDNSEQMADHRKKLAIEAINSMLKDVINSNWSIAVTTLGSRLFPKALEGAVKNPDRSKPANAPPYEQAFTKAINNLQEARASSVTDNDGLTIFIIVTNNNLDQTTENALDKLLADTSDNLVFALLDLEDQHEGADKYLEWRDDNDQQQIDRYGSINHEDYRKMLEEFSSHAATVLRRNFYLKGHYSMDANINDPIIMRIAVDPVTDLKGLLPANDLVIRDRRLLTKNDLPDGMCLEIDYPVAGDRR